jgi:hypothetical protein
MESWQCPREWSQWSEWLQAGLHGRCRWRLPILLMGLLFAHGRRTVTSWLRAAGVSDDFQDYYYFISSLGRKVQPLAERLLVLMLVRLPLGDTVLGIIDDTPTKRYGPKVQGAGIHRHPSPGPADQKFLYGHIWVTLSLAVRHALWGTIALPLLSRLYVRQKDIGKIPKKYGWSFHTKLELAAELMEWLAERLFHAGKTLRIVVDGFYPKRPFLKRARKARVTIIGRLRKDAALRDLPPQPKTNSRGRPRKYGLQRISLAKRAGQQRGWQTIDCLQYGRWVTKTYKTFLATYRPAYGLIRVVIVREEQGCHFLFSTDPNMDAREILEAFADRAAIEQDFHDVKEVWGAGQQQVRNIWANLGCWHLCLWMHSLVELWAWKKSKAEICDRSGSPWDDSARRPSHADRRKALRGTWIDEHFSSLAIKHRVTPKIRHVIQVLKQLTL